MACANYYIEDYRINYSIFSVEGEAGRILIFYSLYIGYSVLVLLILENKKAVHLSMNRILAVGAEGRTRTGT